MADPHVFLRHGQAFAFHPGTGRFLALSEDAHGVLCACAGVAPGKVRGRLKGLQAGADAVAEALALERQGFFFPVDTGLSEAEAEIALTARFGADMPRTETVLAISQGCNLACGYCYCRAETGGISGRKMEAELVRRVIERLLEVSGPCRRIRVVLGGGEPLTNRSGFLRLLETGDALAATWGKRITYVITTNAVLLDDEVAAAMARRDVEILVSLDGPKEVHDRQRKTCGGEGSFDAALAGAKRVLRVRRTVPVRCTLTKGTPRLVELLEFFEAQGFSRVELRPALPGSRPGPLDCDEETLLEFERQEEEEVLPWILERFASEKEPVYFPYREFVCRQAGAAGAPARPSIFRCGACRGAATVAADGAVFPCNRFLGMPRWRLECADVEPSFRSAAAFWRAYHASIEPQCRDCWARPLCVGPCPHEIANEDSTFSAPQTARCEERRRFFERAAHVLYVLQTRHPAALARTVARGPRYGLFEPALTQTLS